MDSSVEYCSPYLWNITGTTPVPWTGMWTGDVKVLPSLSGEQTYPDSFAALQLKFLPPVKGATTGVVTVNLTRTYDFPSKPPPQCITQYSYTCSKTDDVQLTPSCNYLDDFDASTCCATGGCLLKPPVVPVTPTNPDACYQFVNPLEVSKTCPNTPCTGFFWCEHFLMSYEPTSFALTMTAVPESVLHETMYTMKMITAGKFQSGCDATARDDYQLQAFVYSGLMGNPCVLRCCYCCCVLPPPQMPLMMMI